MAVKKGYKLLYRNGRELKQIRVLLKSLGLTVTPGRGFSIIDVARFQRALPKYTLIIYNNKADSNSYQFKGPHSKKMYSYVVKS